MTNKDNKIVTHSFRADVPLSIKLDKDWKRKGYKNKSEYITMLIERGDD